MHASDNTPTTAPQEAVTITATPLIYNNSGKLDCSRNRLTSLTELEKLAGDCTSPDYYNKLVFRACLEADFVTLVILFKSCNLIDPTYDDSAAWKLCVRRLDRQMCELFIKYFGSQFFHCDKSLRDACVAGNREIAMFILGLYGRDQPFTDEEALEEASRKGHTDLVMHVLNNWVHNTYTDLTWMCITAMTGAAYGKHMALFDAVLAKYKAYITSWPFTPEFNLIGNVVRINREILMLVAGTRNYECFNKVLDGLDVDFSAKSDDKYVAMSRTRGYSRCKGARLGLFSKCCNLRDSRMIDALIAKYGGSILAGLGLIGFDRQAIDLFGAACTNNHASVIKLIAERNGIDKALALFNHCASNNKPDLCAVFVNTFGSQIVNQIEADAELTKNPIVRGLLHTFFLSKYELYR